MKRWDIIIWQELKRRAGVVLLEMTILTPLLEGRFAPTRTKNDTPEALHDLVMVNKDRLRHTYSRLDVATKIWIPQSQALIWTLPAVTSSLTCGTCLFKSKNRGKVVELQIHDDFTKEMGDQE